MDDPTPTVEVEPTPTPPRPPTWSEMRATALAAGADPDARPGPPRGLAGAQHERWMTGHDYSPGRPPIARPPAPAPRKRPRVEVRNAAPARPASTRTRAADPPRPARTTPAAAEGQAVARIVAQLRDAGVTSARIASDHAGRPAVEVDDRERARAARLLGSWTLGQS